MNRLVTSIIPQKEVHFLLIKNANDDETHFDRSRQVFNRLFYSSNENLKFYLRFIWFKLNCVSGDSPLFDGIHESIFYHDFIIFSYDSVLIRA